jgi:CheY-like chemotaxis protein
MAKTGKKVRIYSALEVANICGVVNQTAINWIKSDYLKAFMTPGGQYRVYSEDLYQFLQSRGMRIPDELRESRGGEERAKSLLIVDDDQALNDLLARFFSRTKPGLKLYQAFDGFEAGRLVTEAKPGVVVLDINLPGIDGFKLCRQIKSEPELGNPIIIAISGFNVPDMEKRILRDGADAFLAKPFEPSQLAEAVDALLNRIEEHQT